jgi:hypothetical protein
MKSGSPAIAWICSASEAGASAAVVGGTGGGVLRGGRFGIADRRERLGGFTLDEIGPLGDYRTLFR